AVRGEEYAGRRGGVGYRVLEGRGAEIHLPGRRPEREGVCAGPADVAGADKFRRRRTSARAVFRNAQHRGGLEGEHLHHGNVRRETGSAVSLQRPGTRPKGKSGRRLAEVKLRVRGSRI